EANLRAGVASTATASPFGFSGGAFNVVTINAAGTLDINNLATRIGGLQGTGIATNLAGTANTVLTLDVAAGNSLTFNGDLTDGGSAVAFAKTGSGSQILAGTIAISGATSVLAGKLQVDGVSTRSSAYTVSADATLAGRGLIQGAVTVNSGGNLAGANLAATLNYAPSAGDLLYIVANDQIDSVTGTFANLPQGATLTLLS